MSTMQNAMVRETIDKMSVDTNKRVVEGEMLLSIFEMLPDPDANAQLVRELLEFKLNQHKALLVKVASIKERLT